MCAEVGGILEKKVRLRELKSSVQRNLNPGLALPGTVFSTPQDPAQCHKYLEFKKQH